jgi:hypothetical protein
VSECDTKQAPAALLLGIEETWFLRALHQDHAIELLTLRHLDVHAKAPAPIAHGRNRLLLDGGRTFPMPDTFVKNAMIVARGKGDVQRREEPAGG